MLALLIILQNKNKFKDLVLFKILVQEQESIDPHLILMQVKIDLELAQVGERDMDGLEVGILVLQIFFLILKTIY